MTATVRLADLVEGQPFCAGLLLLRADRLVFTLAKPSRWSEDSSGRPMIEVACVGGGQEPGEGVLQCAMREALEEVGRPVTPRPAPQTRWFDLDGSERVVRVTEEPAPVSVELRQGPSLPYRAGLPTGPVLYIVHYLAELPLDPLPGDVPALIEMPISSVKSLCDGPTVDEALRRGLLLHEWTAIPRNAQLVIPSGSPEERFVRSATEFVTTGG